jgi:hypothetical protein
MSEHDADVSPAIDPPAYEEPVVEDLEAPDGPAVTAAGISQPK